MFFKVELTQEQYAHIKDSLPVQRGNVRLTNLQSAQRDLVCRRAWLQVAWASQTFWPLAYHLHAHEPLGKKWSPDAGLRETSDGSDCADSNRSALIGLDCGEGTSGWNRRFKKMARKLSASRAAGGIPKSTWSQPMTERSSPSRCRPETITMRHTDVPYCKNWDPCRRAFRS